MANTYELIASVTVGAGGASTIDFLSIPSTYTDLVLEYSVRETGSLLNDAVFLSFNGGGSNLSSRNIIGDGSATGSQTYGTQIALRDIPGANATSNVFSNHSVYIPNYAGASNKSVSGDCVMENNGTTLVMGLVAGLWANTTAINAIKLTPGTGNFVQYSTAYLYGVKNA